MAPAEKPFELTEATAVERTLLALDPTAGDFSFFRPLLEYWDDRRRGRVAPGRVDIDPLDLSPSLLPHVVLIDVEHEPLDFRYRLAGTAADHIHGMGLKGVRVLDLRPERFATLLHGDLVRMTEDLMPQFVRHGFTNQAAKTRRFRVLRLPLCDDDGRLAMVLVLAEFGALKA